jgi:hypothetical protein
MVDSLPPSGTDPDNQTIITNSNGKLSVALDGLTLDVGSSGKIQVFETTQYLASFEDNDSGDWTGITEVEDGIATTVIGYDRTRSASVTADLTDVDALNFRINLIYGKIKIKFDEVQEGQMDPTDGYETIEISGLDNYGPNTTVTIEADHYREEMTPNPGEFRIDYVRGNPIQPESRKFELVDTGGL